MSIIPKQLKTTREAVTVKLASEVAESLRLYAEFIDSTQEYVVNAALARTFRQDRKFREWRAGRSNGGRK